MVSVIDRIEGSGIDTEEGIDKWHSGVGLKGFFFLVIIAELVADGINEAGVLGFEDEVDFGSGAVALFGDVENVGVVGGIGGGFLLFVFFAVEEHHDVGILLDGTGFAEIV